MTIFSNAIVKRIGNVFFFAFFTVFLLSSSSISHAKISRWIERYSDTAGVQFNSRTEPVIEGLSKEAYAVAVKGFDSIRSTGVLHNERILSIVDFSLPSFKKRLFIIDIVTGKLLFSTFVSHGRNSGKEFATKFSNEFHSFQSSLGFYITGQTYRGHHGYSLRLQGMEQGINDNAFSRGIVMHAATYVNACSAEKTGSIGRSEGCPAIPVNIHRAIIGLIKDGTCLFVYGADKNYLAQSKYLHKSFKA